MAEYYEEIEDGHIHRVNDENGNPIIHIRYQKRNGKYRTNVVLSEYDDKNRCISITETRSNFYVQKIVIEYEDKENPIYQTKEIVYKYDDKWIKVAYRIFEKNKPISKFINY